MKTVEGYILRAIGNNHILNPEGAGLANYNKMIALNASAAYLWKEVEGKEFTAQTLETLLLEHYDIDIETVKADVVKLLEEWMKEGIITD